MVEPTVAASAKVSGVALSRADKIVIAIHGIGDQYRNATIQSVVSSFGKFANYVATMPLGRLGVVGGEPFTLRGPPPPEPPLDKIGFVEVYWAHIPREVQKEGYTIEETKAWARTVVERLRARYKDYARDLSEPAPDGGMMHLKLHREDFFAAADAIDEMIETFAILDHLLAIAEKAGILKFDLNDLLITYVGDVQIVADFSDQRRRILDQFGSVLQAVNKANPNAEIHIVAHSEGTVIAFMGMLEAMCDQPRADGKMQQDPPDWVRQVRGFMTIGSPIDKHIVLWPDIWDYVQTPHPRLAEFRPPSALIRWRNYYDYGDPVGFRLDTARDWLADPDRRWDRFFEFNGDCHDYGFGRYFLPGQAHNDYWTDEGVFGHFIQTVVGLKSPSGRDFAQRPGNKVMPRIGSWVIPYLIVYLLIFAGVYLIYKGTVEYLYPKGGGAVDPHIRQFTKNVVGISALMFGMVALGRIPRLTRAKSWWFAAAAAFVAGAAIYLRFVQDEIKRWHMLGLFDSYPAWVSGAAVIACAFAVVAFTAWASRQKLWRWVHPPLSWVRPLFVGARPLIIPGGILVLGAVAWHVLFPVDDSTERVLWPLLLASAAFFYLWWLATLIFDLVFVWHRYIRRSVAQDYLYALRKRRKKVEAGIAPPPNSSSSASPVPPPQVAAT